jgi:protein associated with RNAse G/E
MKLELLNSEGPILTIYKFKDNGVFIYSRQFYKKPKMLTSPEELIRFMSGEITFTDSDGKKWNYLEHSESMKPTQSKIDEFLNN